MCRSTTNLAILAGLSSLPEGGLEDKAAVIAFSTELQVVPDSAILLKFVKEWAGCCRSGRSMFYSAEEELEVEGPLPLPAKEGKAKATKAKATEKAKRASAQQVAEQIQHLSMMMPVITTALTSIQEEQMRLHAMSSFRSQCL